MRTCYWKPEEKGFFFLIVAENLAGLCHAIMWKARLVSNESHYLAEKISKEKKVQTDFFFLLRVKCERREIN